MGQRPYAYLMYGYKLADAEGNWNVRQTDEWHSLDVTQIPWLTEKIAERAVEYLKKGDVESEEDEPEEDEEDFEDGTLDVSTRTIVKLMNERLRENNIHAKTVIINTDYDEGGYYLIHSRYDTDWDADRLIDPGCFNPDPVADLSLSMAVTLLGLKPNQDKPFWILAATY